MSASEIVPDFNDSRWIQVVGVLLTDKNGIDVSGGAGDVSVTLNEGLEVWQSSPHGHDTLAGWNGAGRGFQVLHMSSISAYINYSTRPLLVQGAMLEERRDESISDDMVACAMVSAQRKLRINRQYLKRCMDRILNDAWGIYLKDNNIILSLPLSEISYQINGETYRKEGRAERIEEAVATAEAEVDGSQDSFLIRLVYATRMLVDYMQDKTAYSPGFLLSYAQQLLIDISTELNGTSRGAEQRARASLQRAICGARYNSWDRYLEGTALMCVRAREAREAQRAEDIQEGTSGPAITTGIRAA
jgi:hypothetical protein